MRFTKKSLSKISLSILFFLLVSSGLNAQEVPEKTENQFWKNVRFGGGFGLSFGDGFFGGTISPQAIYQFNPQFGLGVGLNGTINNRKNIYKSTILGGSLIGLYNPADQIQLSAEFEELNVNRKFQGDFAANSDQNYWYSALFLGAAYRTGGISVGLRYDVLYDKEKSVYAEPWVPFVRLMF
jgi:hypothetical protein